MRTPPTQGSTIRIILMPIAKGVPACVSYLIGLKWAENITRAAFQAFDHRCTASGEPLQSVAAPNGA